MTTTQSTPRWGACQSNWFVAVVNPNCHGRAEDELTRRLGYRTFVPRLRKWVSHARVKKSVRRPLLGRYLFVEIPAEDGTEAARTANGLEGFVSVGGRPITLPEGCVEDLMRREMSGEWDFVTGESVPDGQGGWRVNQAMPIGARVRIVAGEFDGLLATLTSAARGRVQVKLLGKNITRNIYPMMVRPAA